jgi:hypothetical protein
MASVARPGPVLEDRPVPLAEAALAMVAAKVLDHLADQALAAVGGLSSQRLRSWLGREPQQLACQLALARTEARFAERHPAWHAALFDAHFLATEGAPLLARTLSRGAPATPDELAAAWARQLGGATGRRHVEELVPAAADVLRWWREELGHHEVFRAVLDSRSLDRLADSAAAGAEAVRDLRVGLARALGELDRTLVRARYPALEDHIDWPSRRATRSPPAFIGREWVFERIDQLVQRSRAGYVRIVAEAGLGKTALAIALAARHGAPLFLFSEPAGRVRTDREGVRLSV